MKLNKGRWKRRGRLKTAEAAGIEGARKVRLKPDPVLREITLDVAEEGLKLLGINVEDLIVGNPITPVPPIAGEKRDRFFKAVVENWNRFDLGEMPFDLAAGAVTQVAAAFFFECAKHVGRLSAGQIGK